MRILIFGASITQGLWDSEGGWVARLRRHYDTLRLHGGSADAEYPIVFNLGISGDTSSGLLKRFDNEVEARLWPDEEYMFIFSVGANNAKIMNGARTSDVDAYAKDLTKLISKARKYSDKIMMVGLNPCDESRTNPVHWNSEASYLNRDLNDIDRTMRGVCSDHNVHYVPVFDQFQKKLNNGEDLLADGLHPNNAGHQLLFEMIEPTATEIARQ